MIQVVGTYSGIRPAKWFLDFKRLVYSFLQVCHPVICNSLDNMGPQPPPSPSYCHQPNFVDGQKALFLGFARIFRTFLPCRIAGKILLGKIVRKMRQLHIQKINKVYICFGLFCFILNIHSNAYIYMYRFICVSISQCLRSQSL